jgi:lysophospholipase L1-like esterase
MRLLIFLVVVVLIGLIVWLTGSWRFVKTLYLIARVTPYEQTVESAPTILVLGDSTGYGTGAQRGDESIAGLIGADYPQYTIVNKSKNGRTIGEALVFIKTQKETKEYALIVVQLGGNDILQKRPLDVVRSELSELIGILLEKSPQVVMLTSGNVGAAAAYAGTSKAEEYEKLTRQYRDMVIPLAAESGVTYIDLFEEPIDDAFLREPKRYLAIDGLHPSSAGYGYWYARVKPVVATALTPPITE